MRDFEGKPSNMTEIIRRDRKSAVLRHPILPCLSRYHTINLLSGCPNECRYCYAQSFASHPGWGRVVFYDNTLDCLRRELPRKRKKPELVYFSTACEPFIPLPFVLNDLYAAMKLVLDEGIFLLISTKSEIPESFIHLFAQHPGKVHVQVGMTTINENIRYLLEPKTGSVCTRLKNLGTLIKCGVDAELRMDPLVPGLTDREESFASLLREVSKLGVNHAVASYIFLRPSIPMSLSLSYQGWLLSDIVECYYTHRIEDYCGTGTIWIVTPGYRREKYDELKRIAAEYGISLNLCRCKNADITAECCHPQLPEYGSQDAQMTLF
jgi:DNA repair photolyase